MTVYDNARELESNLPTFLTQEVETGYEVIVVDESSTDDTDDVLKRFKQSHPYLYTTFLPKPDHNVVRRRLALTIGVKAAKNEWIILSDIQAVPNTEDWLKEVSDAIGGSTRAMVGYFRKKGLLLETFDDIGQTRQVISKAERKKAYGHRGKRLKYLRGKYDFIAVRREDAHDILKYFEQSISLRRLLGLRLSIACHNLF